MLWFVAEGNGKSRLKHNTLSGSIKSGPTEKSKEYTNTGRFEVEHINDQMGPGQICGET